MSHSFSICRVGSMDPPPMAFFLEVSAEWFVGRGRAVQVRGCEPPLRVLFSVLERAGQTDTHSYTDRIQEAKRDIGRQSMRNREKETGR